MPSRLIRLIGLIPHVPVLWSKRNRRRRKLFDARFYLSKYPDVAAAQVDPWLHYLKHGAAERRKPNALFEPNYYLTLCPDARSANADPLTHFVENQSGAWINPHVLFDCTAYVNANRSLRERPANPLIHYLRSSPSDNSCEEGAYFGAS